MDEELRRAEREALSGDREAGVAWLTLKRRRGELTDEQLELAAYLGYAPARVLIDRKRYPVDALDEVLDVDERDPKTLNMWELARRQQQGPPEPYGLLAWVGGLQGFSDLACARAVVALGRVAVAVWERVEETPVPRQVLDANERWILCPCEPCRETVMSLTHDLRAEPPPTATGDGEALLNALSGAGARYDSTCGNTTAGAMTWIHADGVRKLVRAELLPWALGLGDPLTDGARPPIPWPETELPGPERQRGWLLAYLHEPEALQALGPQPRIRTTETEWHWRAWRGSASVAFGHYSGAASWGSQVDQWPIGSELRRELQVRACVACGRLIEPYWREYGGGDAGLEALRFGERWLTDRVDPGEAEATALREAVYEAQQEAWNRLCDWLVEELGPRLGPVVELPTMSRSTYRSLEVPEREREAVMKRCREWLAAVIGAPAMVAVPGQSTVANTTVAAHQGLLHLGMGNTWRRYERLVRKRVEGGDPDLFAELGAGPHGWPEPLFEGGGQVMTEAAAGEAARAALIEGLRAR